MRNPYLNPVSGSLLYQGAKNTWESHGLVSEVAASLSDRRLNNLISMTMPAWSTNAFLWVDFESRALLNSAFRGLPGRLLFYYLED